MNGSVVATFRRTLPVFEKQIGMLSILLKEDIANRWTDKGKQLIEELQLALLILKKCYESETKTYWNRISHIDELRSELSRKKSTAEWRREVISLLEAVKKEAYEVANIARKKSDGKLPFLHQLSPQVNMINDLLPTLKG